MSPSPLLLPDEVEQIALLCDPTRLRQENLGRFPKRLKLAGRKIAYRRADIEEWAKDPEAWRARKAVGSEVA